MKTLIQVRATVENEIRMAFHGVTLGRGISLRQAQLADGIQVAVRDARLATFAEREITDDWSRVPLKELERDCIAHLDALGFRYYIPALMLSVLSHYEPSSMRIIGTLAGLYPKKGNSWEFHIRRYSLLSPAQKTAIARFLMALPKLIELDYQGQKMVSRGLRNYWGEYLHTTALKGKKEKAGSSLRSG
ncbi:MAG TPA: DUF6714 family protein [Candidatus Micrarchaeia archaeon]|jgi:hypothetical protein|nr:DUF6714 family protein [Candidatus Micrarchaeia archaeon]